MSDIRLRTTFNTNAERYHAMRPLYPEELFDKLVADTCLPKLAKLLEIGPGTGQATTPLAERGYEITAIELGNELASKASETLANYPNVEIITGAFEDVELLDQQYDLVYSATAFHWIKSAFKFAKPHALLKPNGYLAIIHTEHVSDEIGDAFFHASWPIYRKYDRADSTTAVPDFTPPRLKELRPPEKVDKKLFLPESFTVFPMTLSYSSQEYARLLATYSPNLAMAEDDRMAFLEEIRNLIDKDFGGRLDKHYGMTLMINRKI